MKQGINSLESGSGLPLVFQHGLAANITQVDTLLTGLEGIHLMAIDCPGQGHSQLPANYRPSFDQYADEVLDFLDQKGIEAAVFGGISMGSGIAVNIALRFPERVRGLVLVRPAWLDAPKPENLSILIPAAQCMGQPTGIVRFKESSEFKKIAPVAAATSVLGVFAPEQQPELQKVIERMFDDKPFDSLASLKIIDVPTLIIANEDDPLHPSWMAEKIRDSIGDSQLKKVISRYIDNDLHRDQVRQHIKDFIKEKNLINEKQMEQ